LLGSGTVAAAEAFDASVTSLTLTIVDNVGMLELLVIYV
jgi:hypothetical protein